MQLDRYEKEGSEWRQANRDEIEEMLPDFEAGAIATVKNGTNLIRGKIVQLLIITGTLLIELDDGQDVEIQLMVPPTLQ